MTIFYKGFSSSNWLNRKQFKLTNIELVKQDLHNHIFTTKGSRVMMPNWGTRIPLMTFEPNNEKTRQIIEDDLREVFNSDKRVELLGLKVYSPESGNSIYVRATVKYIEFNVTEELNLSIQTGN